MSWLTKFFEMLLGVKPAAAKVEPAADADSAPALETASANLAVPAKPDLAANSGRASAQANSQPGDAESQAQPDSEPIAPKPAGRDGPEVRVLVATFLNDREAGFTKRIVDTLSAAQMIDIKLIEATIAGPGDHPTSAKLVALLNDARRKLDDENADLFIYGEVLRNGLRLRFVPAQPAPEARPEEFALADTLLIAHNFGSELANLLYASVLAAALPAKPTHRQELTPYLVGAAEKSLKLLDGLPDGTDLSQVGAIYTCLGVVSASLWRLAKKPAGLTAAAAAFEKASREGPKEISPLVMAELKIRLGIALQELAIANDDTVMFDDGLDAFEAVTTALNPKSHGREWALAYVCLGTAYLTRAKKEVAAADCERAAKAFDAAMQVFSKEKDRPRWLDTMTLKGTALVTAGAISAGVRQLEDAVEVLREVLGARNRATQPTQWAQASNGLGSAIFALAKRTGDLSHLDEAIACYDGALAVYESLNQAVSIGVVRKNQQRAQRLRETMAD